MRRNSGSAMPTIRLRHCSKSGTATAIGSTSLSAWQIRHQVSWGHLFRLTQHVRSQFDWQIVRLVQSEYTRQWIHRVRAVKVPEPFSIESSSDQCQRSPRFLLCADALPRLCSSFYEVTDVLSHVSPLEQILTKDRPQIFGGQECGET